MEFVKIEKTTVLFDEGETVNFISMLKVLSKDNNLSNADIKRINYFTVKFQELQQLNGQ